MNTTRCTSRIALLAFSLLLVAACAAPAQEIKWRRDYAAALKESQEKNRPLFVDFYTSQCIWCVKLDAATFARVALWRFTQTSSDAGAVVPLSLAPRGAQAPVTLAVQVVVVGAATP